MKSACCQHEIVIHTDPKNTEYVIVSGAQRKTEDFDVEDAETLLLPADEGSNTCPQIYFCLWIHCFQMHDVSLYSLQKETSLRILCISSNIRERIFGRRKKRSQF